MIQPKTFESLFKHLDTLPWKNEAGLDEIFDIAAQNFEKLSAGHSKNHNLIRLAGQSGSGKTTQLLPAATAYVKQKNLSPIVFAVRNFVQFYPDFNNIAKNIEAGQIRELTNGFALRCLTVSLALAIEQGYDIVLEVTLLSEEYEKFLMSLLLEHGYSVLCLCVAANKEISDRFIIQRMLGQSKEGGRKVSAESSDFFYSALEKSLSFYAKNFNFRTIIWNATSMLPVFDGSVKECLPCFFEERKKIPERFENAEALLEAKIKYLTSH